MSDVKRGRKHISSVFRGQRLYLLIAILVTSLAAVGFIWAQKTVTITIDGTSYETRTMKYNVYQCLAEAGVNMGPYDAANVPLDTKISNGMKVDVYRGGPVTIIVDGKTITSVVAKATVEDAVQAAGVVLQAQDQLVPDRAASFRPGMEIRIIRVAEKIKTREKAIAFPIERRDDDTLEKGTSHVVQMGRAGVQREKIQVRYEDGRETAVTILEKQLVAAPQPEIVLVGTRDIVQTSRGAMRFKRAIEMEATAYLPTDGSTTGITAIGVPARNGIVAVDPKVIPLGSHVYVKGYGLALAADTGGAIVGDRIDLCMENANEAWRFGRRVVKVYVLAE